MGIAVVAIVIILLAIIFINVFSTGKKKSRQDFLQELTQFLEGRLEPIVEKENSYRITFSFEGQEFVFEDIEDQGFQKKSYKVFLKTKTQTKLNLGFTEGEVKATRAQIVIASDIPDDPIRGPERVHVPEVLRKFKIHTNNSTLTNLLLEDDEVVDILAHLRNTNEQGYAFLPFRILEGVIILEIFSLEHFKPNIVDLYRNVASIENYLPWLLLIAKKVNNFSPI